MAFPARGFIPVEFGHENIRHSTVSSGATFLAGNPVAIEDVSRTLIEATSATTKIYGVALSDASASFAPNRSIPVLVPTDNTVFAGRVQTGVAAGGLEVGETLNIEKAGDYFRVDTDSKASARVVLVNRGFSNQAWDSDDSSVYFQFLGDTRGQFGSNDSARLG